MCTGVNVSTGNACKTKDKPYALIEHSLIEEMC
jgi:hypothetical protein